MRRGRMERWLRGRRPGLWAFGLVVWLVLWAACFWGFLKEMLTQES